MGYAILLSMRATKDLDVLSTAMRWTRALIERLASNPRPHGA